jgi:hypothetical protein
MRELLSPSGPLNVRPRSEAPRIALSDRFSLLPSIILKSITELRAFPLEAGKAPDRKSTDLTKSTLIIPVGPPDEP